MKYIITARGGGKTTEIIKEVKKFKGYLLVHNETERVRLINLYPDLRDKIFSWHSLPGCLMGKERRKVFMDNADYFISEQIGCCCELGGISLNLPEEKPNPTKRKLR